MKNGDSIRWLTPVGIAAYLIVSYAVFLFVDQQQFRRLEMEDGFFESIGAIYFFLAAIMFFLTYWRGPGGTSIFFIRTRKNVVFLFLSLLFLFAAGEEISWGQRIFQLETPDFMVEANIQRETNLHNLEIFAGRYASREPKTGIAAIFTTAGLFRVFWLGFCLCLPALVLFRPSVKPALERSGIPVVPLGIGIFFLLNYALSKISIYFPMAVSKELVEVKESNFAFLFLLIAWHFFMRYGVSRRPERDPEHAREGGSESSAVAGRADASIRDLNL